MERDVILLLTASVNVKGMVFTALQDSNIRETHYLEAIKYYYANTDVRILLVENTGHNFKNQLSADICNSERIELLSFEGNNFPKEKGKGYGELEALSYAVKNSTFIGDNTVIIKVTGRYKIKNIRDFIKSAKDGKRCNCQVLYFKGQRKAFSGIFCLSKFFLKDYLIKNHDLMNDARGVYFEHVLATTLLEYLANGSNYDLLPSFPRLLGISGTENIQHRTEKYSFWLIRNIIYKLVKINYKILDKVIMTLFQG